MEISFPCNIWLLKFKPDNLHFPFIYSFYPIPHLICETLVYICLLVVTKLFIVCILVIELYCYFVLARSGDSTARIWTIPDGPCGSIQSSPASVHVLKHFKGRTNEKSKDVTTLDWNVGSLMLYAFIFIIPYSRIVFWSKLI